MPLALDVDVPTEVLLVLEDWVVCGLLRKNPAAPAPIMTIAITTTNSSDAVFVLSRGPAAELNFVSPMARFAPFK